MAEAEILKLFELHYSDLKLLASSSSTSKDDIERLETIRANIMETLGPRGPGLLSVIGVPRAPILRRNLLPLARKVALLNPDHRKRIFKEHKLGSDVPLKNPDRNVSSFAMQLRYEQGGQLDDLLNSDQDLPDDEFKNLGSTFKELGFCMMELGLCLARICDKAIGGQDLEQSLLESCMAKGRLIHYHSILDSIVLKGGIKGGCLRRLADRKKDQVEHTNVGVNSNKVGPFGNSNLWQQWHYDYGIFTVLTDPLFILPSYLPGNTEKEQCTLSRDQESPSPSGHTYLQIFNPSKSKVQMVKSSPESFIIQVGESADILSKGQLRSTLHCVCRPAKFDHLSRETFVVFLQPAWSKTFSISDNSTENCKLDGQRSGVPNDKNYIVNQDQNSFIEEIDKIIPPLSLRLKDGMTFAEFSRETTKQYYGGGGLQSSG